MGWPGNRIPCQFLGGREEGAATVWYGQLVSLENHLTDHVSGLCLSCQIL